jgi:hypothetical protein
LHSSPWLAQLRLPKAILLKLISSFSN